MIASVVLLVHIACITIDGLLDEIKPADVALVLGNQVLEHGTPHPRLQARLNRALDLYKQGAVPKIIVSGGLGKEGHYEGDVMAAYLTERGVKINDILIDKLGTNTRASAINYVALKKEHGFTSVVVVSQFFHISRARLAFEQAEAETIYTAHAQYFELRDLYSTLREIPGYYAYWLKYKISTKALP